MPQTAINASLNDPVPQHPRVKVPRIVVNAPSDNTTCDLAEPGQGEALEKESRQEVSDKQEQNAIQAPNQVASAGRSCAALKLVDPAIVAISPTPAKTKKITALPFPRVDSSIASAHHAALDPATRNCFKVRVSKPDYLDLALDPIQVEDLPLLLRNVDLGRPANIMEEVAEARANNAATDMKQLETVHALDDGLTDQQCQSSTQDSSACSALSNVDGGSSMEPLISTDSAPTVEQNHPGDDSTEKNPVVSLPSSSTSNWQPSNEASHVRKIEPEAVEAASRQGIKFHCGIPKVHFYFAGSSGDIDSDQSPQGSSRERSVHSTQISPNSSATSNDYDSVEAVPYPPMQSGRPQPPACDETGGQSSNFCESSETSGTLPGVSESSSTKIKPVEVPESSNNTTYLSAVPQPSHATIELDQTLSGGTGRGRASDQVEDQQETGDIPTTTAEEAVEKPKSKSQKKRARQRKKRDAKKALLVTETQADGQAPGLNENLGPRPASPSVVTVDPEVSSSGLPSMLDAALVTGTIVTPVSVEPETPEASPTVAVLGPADPSSVTGEFSILTISNIVSSEGLVTEAIPSLESSNEAQSTDTPASANAEVPPPFDQSEVLDPETIELREMQNDILRGKEPKRWTDLKKKLSMSNGKARKVLEQSKPQGKFFHLALVFAMQHLRAPGFAQIRILEEADRSLDWFRNLFNFGDPRAAHVIEAGKAEDLANPAEIVQQIPVLSTTGALPEYHHINYLGQRVHDRSATPPEVSMWAAIRCATLYHEMKIPRASIHNLVLAWQAWKYIDPFYYCGPLDLIKITSAKMRDLVIGYVYKTYEPHGTWVYDDDYDMDESIPYYTTQIPGYVSYTVEKGRQAHYEAMRCYAFQDSDLDPVVARKLTSESSKRPGHGPSPLRVTEVIEHTPAAVARRLLTAVRSEPCQAPVIVAENPSTIFCGSYGECYQTEEQIDADDRDFYSETPDGDERSAVEEEVTACPEVSDQGNLSDSTAEEEENRNDHLAKYSDSPDRIRDLIYPAQTPTIFRRRPIIDTTDFSDVATEVSEEENPFSDVGHDIDESPEDNDRSNASRSHDNGRNTNFWSMEPAAILPATDLEFESTDDGQTVAAETGEVDLNLEPSTPPEVPSEDWSRVVTLPIRKKPTPLQIATGLRKLRLVPNDEKAEATAAQTHSRQISAALVQLHSRQPSSAYTSSIEAHSRQASSSLTPLTPLSPAFLAELKDIALPQDATEFGTRLAEISRESIPATNTDASLNDTSLNINDLDPVGPSAGEPMQGSLNKADAGSKELILYESRPWWLLSKTKVFWEATPPTDLEASSNDTPTDLDNLDPLAPSAVEPAQGPPDGANADCTEVILYEPQPRWYKILMLLAGSLKRASTLLHKSPRAEPIVNEEVATAHKADFSIPGDIDLIPSGPNFNEWYFGKPTTYVGKQGIKVAKVAGGVAMMPVKAGVGMVKMPFRAVKTTWQVGKWARSRFFGRR